MKTIVIVVLTVHEECRIFTGVALYAVLSSPMMVGTDIRLMTPIMKEVAVCCGCAARLGLDFCAKHVTALDTVHWGGGRCASTYRWHCALWGGRGRQGPPCQQIPDWW